MMEKLDKYFENFVASKNQRNFEKVYLLSSGALFGVTMKIVNNQEVAQECLQESFIKIWNKIDTYSAEKGKPITWMAAIVRNHSIDYTRKQKLLIADDFELDSLATDQPQTDTEIERNEENLQLDDCISQLKPNSKDAIFMAYYSDMTYEHIARALGFPVSTVKTWVRRSKAFIKKCMQGLH